jgi:hypothetical protein
MGKIVRIELSKIRPTQIGLRRDSFAYLMQHDCDAVPAVREYTGNFYVLDGHHRFLTEDLKSREEVESYLAESEYDLMDPDEFPGINLGNLTTTNRLISSRFGNVIKKAERLELMGLKRLNDYQNLYHMVRNLKGHC